MKDNTNRKIKNTTYALASLAALASGCNSLEGPGQYEYNDQGVVWGPPSGSAPMFGQPSVGAFGYGSEKGRGAGVYADLNLREANTGITGNTKFVIQYADAKVEDRSKDAHITAADVTAGLGWSGMLGGKQSFFYADALLDVRRENGAKEVNTGAGARAIIQGENIALQVEGGYFVGKVDYDKGVITLGTLAGDQYSQDADQDGFRLGGGLGATLPLSDDKNTYLVLRGFGRITLKERDIKGNVPSASFGNVPYSIDEKISETFVRADAALAQRGLGALGLAALFQDQHVSRKGDTADSGDYFKSLKVGPTVAWEIPGLEGRGILSGHVFYEHRGKAKNKDGVEFGIGFQYNFGSTKKRSKEISRLLNGSDNSVYDPMNWVVTHQKKSTKANKKPLDKKEKKSKRSMAKKSRKRNRR